MVFPGICGLKKMHFFEWCQIIIDGVMIAGLFYLLRRERKVVSPATAGGSKKIEKVLMELRQLRGCLLELMDTLNGYLDKQLEELKNNRIPSAKTLASSLTPEQEPRDNLADKMENKDSLLGGERARLPDQLNDLNPSLSITGNKEVRSQILNLYQRGWGVDQIARHLQLGKGEVQLIIELTPRK